MSRLTTLYRFLPKLAQKIRPIVKLIKIPKILSEVESVKKCFVV